MSRFRSILPLLSITLGALVVRALFLLHGQGAHPDERHIIMVTEGLRLNDLNPRSFAYGSFPFYLLWVIKSILGVFSSWLGSYDGLFVIGRSLSVLFGSAGVLLCYFLAQRLYNNKAISLIAAGLLAFNFFNIQLSRFFTVDILLTTLAALSLLIFLRLEKPFPTASNILAGLLLGLSVATKVSALSLILPLYFALFLKDWRRGTYSWRELFAHGSGAFLLALSVFFLADPLSFIAEGALSTTAIGWLGTIVFWAAVGFSAFWPKKLGGGERLQALAQIAAIAFCVFLTVEPFAFFDYSKFLHDTREQLSLIKGNWFAPYTWQYVGTMPFFYHLKQIFFYTVGIPASLAIFAGVLFSIFIQFRKVDRNEMLILSWLLPYFLIVAAYQVKFPRYLLPLYPLFFVFAARILVLLYEKLQDLLHFKAINFIAAIPIVIVCLATLLRGLSLISVISQEHGYAQASMWIYENAAPGSRILGPHWDDKLPVTLPGHEARIYDYEGRNNELALYEQDNVAKLNELATQLAGSDYIAFPTPRLQGSVPRLIGSLPKHLSEQPLTTTFLQLLYTGELGYRLVHTFKVEPHIGGLIFNDDLADESISVYDHPKSSIFKNEGHLPAAEIKEKVISNTLKPHLPSMNEMLLANSDSSGLSKAVPSTFCSIVIWYFIILILGLLGTFLLAWILPSYPALVAALGKTCGILLFGIASWYLAYLSPIQLTQESLTALIFVLCAVAFSVLIFLGPQRLRRFSENLLKECLIVEALFFLGFLIFLALRSFQPEIFWGEKPMDAAFFNYFIRLENMPPNDPWAAGRPLQYYYFGSFIFGLLQKLSGTPYGIGFNISLAVIASLHIAGFYGILKTLTKNTTFAASGAFCLLLISNLDVLKLALIDGKELGFDLYWASSRTVHSPGINEYPFWAFLFGDLHAHLITLPFTLLVLGLLAALFLREAPVCTWKLTPLKILLGLSLGSLFVLNSWDFVSYGFITGLVFLYYWARVFKEKWDARRWRSALLLIICDAILMGAFVLLGMGPLFFEAAQNIAPHYGFVTGEEFNSGAQIFRVFGHFAPFIIGAVLLYAIRSVREGLKISKVAWAAIAGLIPIILAFWSIFTPSAPIGFGDIHWSIFLFFALLLVMTALAIFQRRLSRELFFTFFLVAAGAVIICVVELHFLMDRANTLFKFYHALWTIFGIAAVVSVPLLYQFFAEKAFSKEERGVAAAGLLLGTCFFALAFVGSIINMVSLLPFQRIPGPRPTLDGQAYLSILDGDEAKMIDWFNHHVKGTPTIVEAVGSSYGAFTRVAMHTGLPVVIGWEYHVSQRGTPLEIIKERNLDVGRIYNTPDPELAQRLLKKHGASYIVVGNLERRPEPRSILGLEKFEQNPRLFTKVFESGSVRVYSVNG